jgi:predicted dinucleotide-binding enzyme
VNSHLFLHAGKSHYSRLIIDTVCNTIAWCNFPLYSSGLSAKRTAMSNKTSVVLFLLLVLFASTGHADKVAMIGTGNVGAGLGPEFAALGHEIVYGARDPSREDVVALVERTGNGASAASPSDAVVGADIVVLAVPGRLAVEITESLGDLTGKIIIDPTNNYIREGVPRLAIEGSNAEAIQDAAPGSHVVKAFNTLSVRQMVDPASSGGPVSIPIVGNDANAKAKVAGIIAGMGLEPVDVGPLQNARHVEGMLVLWMYGRVNGAPFDFHLRKQ